MEIGYAVNPTPPILSRTRCSISGFEKKSQANMRTSGGCSSRTVDRRDASNGEADRIPSRSAVCLETQYLTGAHKHGHEGLKLRVLSQVLLVFDAQPGLIVHIRWDWTEKRNQATTHPPSPG